MKAGTPGQRALAEKMQMERGTAKMPNFSSAVSAQRYEAKDSLDDFPTPPWGGRAWAEHVPGPAALKGKTCWEPAANRGYLVHGLKDYFGRIDGSDIHDYGAGYPIFDFLTDGGLFASACPVAGMPDWIVTNPPFNRLLQFAQAGMKLSRVGVAIFCRLQAVEGVGRYRKLFEPYADRYCFSQFVERISLVRGTVDPKAGRPAAYGWLTVWHEKQAPEFLLARRHIPPCRTQLERPGDYRL